MNVTEPKKEENSARPNSGIVSSYASRFTHQALRARLPNLKAHLTFWPIIAVGLTLDLWSKKAVFDWLQQQPNLRFSVIDGFLQLVIAVNEGAAFGIFPGRPYLLTAVSIIALIVIFAVFLFGGTRQKLVHIALGLFAAGVCGNLYDRIFNDGLVRDFIDICYHQYHWPAFNIADSMLCVGVGLMIILSFLTEKSSRRHVRQRK